MNNNKDKKLAKIIARQNKKLHITPKDILELHRKYTKIQKDLLKGKHNVQER